MESINPFCLLNTEKLSVILKIWSKSDLIYIYKIYIIIYNYI